MAFGTNDEVIFGNDDEIVDDEEEGKLKKTLKGIADTALSVGSGAAWSIGAPIEAGVKKLTGQVPDWAEESNRLMREKPRQPETEMGQEATAEIGDFLNRYVVPVAPMIIGPLAGSLKGRGRKGAKPTEDIGKKFDTLDTVKEPFGKTDEIVPDAPEVSQKPIPDVMQVTPEGQGVLDPAQLLFKDLAETKAGEARRTLAKETPLELTPETPPYGLADTPYQHTGGMEMSRVNELARPIEEQIRINTQKLKEENLAWEQRNKAVRDEQRFNKLEEQLAPLQEQLSQERVSKGQQRKAMNRQRGAIDLEGIQEGLEKLKTGMLDSLSYFERWRTTFNPKEYAEALNTLEKRNSRDTIAFMSPDEFHQLAKTRPSFMEAGAETKRMPIREGLMKKEGLDQIPYLRLTLDGDVAKVESHNGRHRMDVFKEKGLDLVPVRLRLTDGSGRWGEHQIAGTLPKSIKGENQTSLPMPKILTKDGSPRDLSNMTKDSQFLSSLSPMELVPIDRAAYTINHGFKKGQSGALDLDPFTKPFEKFFAKKVSLPVSTQEMLAKRPGMGKELDGAVPRGPTAENIVKLALQEKDGPPLNESIQSGLTLSADKVKSSLMLGVARWLQYAQKRGEFDFRQEVQPLEKALSGLKKDQAIALQEALKRQQFQGKGYSDAQLQQVGLAPENVRLLREFQKAYDKSFERQNMMLEALGKKPMTKEDFYYSSVWNGDWHVPVKDANGKLVWYIQTMSKREANAALKHLEKNFPDLKLKDLKPEYRPDVKDPNVPRDVIGAYRDMLEFFTDNPEVTSSIKQAMEAYAQERGYGAFGQDVHFLEKGGVRGFEGDRPWKSAKKNAYEGLQAQIHYLRNAYKWTPMQEALAEIKKVMSDETLAAAQPNNLQLTKAVVAREMGLSPNMLKGLEQGLSKQLGYTRAGLYMTMNDIKSLTYLQQLGLSAGYMVATPLQGLVSVPAWHLKASSEGFNLSPARAVKAYGLGLSDATAIFSQHYFNTYKEILNKEPSQFPMSQLGKEAMKYAEDNGIISKNLFDENAGLGEHKAVAGLKNALGGTISFPEKLVRTYAFTSFVHHLKETGKFSDNTSIFQRAEELTNNALTDFRKSERPLIVDKLGVTGQAMYTYHSFLFNMFNQMSTFARQGDWKALTAMVGSLALLGGVQDLPFVNELDGMYNLFKDFVAAKLPQHYSKVTGPGLKGTIISKLPESLAWGHVSTALGWQMSSRFSPNLIDAENPISSLFPTNKMLGNALPIDPLMNPNSTSLTQYAYNNAPPMVKGTMENTMDAFKAPVKGGVIKPTDIGSGEIANYKRDDKDKQARYWGVTSLKEADSKIKSYMNQNESRRVQTARSGNLDHLYSSLRRQDKEDVAKYAKAYFELGGTKEGLTRFLTTKAEKLGMTSDEFMAAHMSTLSRIYDVQRRLEMDKK